MLNNKKTSGALLAAGLAAFAYYKYSKLSEDQKSSLVSDLKQKGQKLYNEYVPQELKNLFAKKDADGSSFDEGSAYHS